MKQNIEAECAVLQQEEYEVIKAIYPDFILDAPLNSTSSLRSIHFQVSVDLPPETRLRIGSKSKNVCDNSASAPTSSIAMQYLPPILLDIYLSPFYPLSEPPDIRSIKADSSWYTEVHNLKTTLLESWTAGETVIYSWLELIRSGEFFQNMDEDGSLKLHHESPGRLVEILMDYDVEEKRRVFLKGTYLCDVCLESHKGTHCILLSCSHVFCKKCLAEFWTTAVQEGELGKLICVDPECMKAKKVATEREIRDVLSDTAFRRWQWLKEKREFEQDSGHAYCPVCESPAKPSPDHAISDKDDSWSRYRECPNCRFTFCRVCRCVWHGAHFDCPVPVQILTRYINATASGEETAWAQSLEQTYTLGVLQRQVIRFKEEARKLRKARSTQATSADILKSEEWLSKCTQCCPKCGAYIQRTEGCNSMVCSLCGQCFCYGCGKLFSAHGNSFCRSYY